MLPNDDSGFSSAARNGSDSLENVTVKHKNYPWGQFTPETITIIITIKIVIVGKTAAHAYNKQSVAIDANIVITVMLSFLV